MRNTQVYTSQNFSICMPCVLYHFPALYDCGTRELILIVLVRILNHVVSISYL